MSVQPVDDGRRGRRRRARSIVDRRRLLAQIGGDASLLRELIGIFLDEKPAIMADLRDAIEHGRSPRVERLAHHLRGTLGALAAAPAAEVAAELERLGESGDLTHVAEILDRLEQRLSLVENELRDLVRAGAPSGEDPDHPSR